MVMDMRSGEVLHSRNADTRLHPASLTKMMTLYVVFQAVEHGELTMDTVITIPKEAAAEPPSKLGLRTGQKIKLRYLVRAAAVKSANDAATALGFAISGSESAFAARMNRTARALGMNDTTFKNAHGLTENGHLSTARDMTTLGRHLFFDYPEYYNLFSRITTDAQLREVSNTNRRFLRAYQGADGIKTGYTRAAGFNLVASAIRGNKRIIATMYGGRSTAQRNEKVAELLDLGFSRVPEHVALRKPSKPPYTPGVDAGRIRNAERAPERSPLPRLRPGSEVPEEMLVAMAETIEATVTAVETVPEATGLPEAAAVPPPPKPETLVEMAGLAEDGPAVPRPRPETLVAETAAPERVVVERLSTSGDRHWGINVGRYASRYQAERVLLQTALTELGTLDEALRKVKHSARGFDANFVGMTRDGAALACERLTARNIECTTLDPAS
ncbi:D-alanyl-D-alanine carboxypeptidase [Psychromarinibacter sp. C21-152]|uniref:D-alanyl-D-alanine carboxypeptidase n=1 Tax=Psychromarinibacter sediminicola TaxID=3033385 RepID=A0AAE3T9Q1_9RHOB|nr:D-alanyl-D-alanine carboxypeptidase family protein [Psychromarinibacter sediminicola]MDF0600775.1 D-alanyl-D-alanine carboxypeptidase [Psychromarinibacter sediminicola]